MTSPPRCRSRRPWLVLVIAFTAVVVAAGLLDVALAQTGPFGVRPSGAPPPAPEGLVGWLLAKQAEFYRALSTTIRAAKQDGSAVVGLLGLSFVYGIFHAAGPGHGKAVISSYLVANEETWRRGIVLSFASALLQALVAITIVGIAAALLHATTRTMCGTDRVIEIVSYALIIAVGVRLLLVKGRSLLSAWQTIRHQPLPVPVGAAVTPSDHLHHDGRQDHHAHAGHVHGEFCGHSHGPAELTDLTGPGGWQRGLSAIVAVGLRPCSGAILVLVFALAQGLFWAGVAATFAMGLGTAITVAAIATLAVGARAVAARFADQRTGFGTLAIRGIELGAAVVIIVFGALLLGGYMMSERLVVVCS